MERPHPYLSCYGACSLADTLTHLPSSLVGEGQGHQSHRVVAAVEEVEELVDEDTGLATTCTCDDEGRAIVVGHSGTLCLIELGEIGEVQRCSASHVSDEMDRWGRA